MLSLLLAVAVAQPVTNNCAPGRNCRARSFTSTTAGVGQVSFAMPNLDVISMGACAIQTNGANLLLGSPSACAASFSGATSATPTAFTVGGHYSLEPSMPAASVAPRAMVGTTTSQRLWVSDGVQWGALGAPHPVKGGVTFVAGTDRLPTFGAFPLRWVVAPISNGAAVAMTTLGTPNTLSNTGCAATGGCPGPTFFTFHRTAAVLGDRSGNHSATAYASAGSYLVTRVGLSSTTGVRVFAGLSAVLPLAAGTSTPAANAAVFRFDTSAGDTQWQACTGNGGAISCTTTGVAVSGSVPLAHQLEVDCREVNASGVVQACTFWVDGQARVRRTTTLPTSGAVGHVATLENLTAAIRDFNIDSISVETR